MTHTILIAVALWLLSALPMSAAENCLSVADPTGDVRVTTATSTTAVQTGRADIRSGVLEQLETGWRATLRTTELFGYGSAERGNLVIMFDRDGVKENNEWHTGDARAGADAYWSVVRATPTSTALEVRAFAFDPSSGKWKRGNTRADVAVSDGNIVVNIPYAELPKVPDMHWRIFTGLGGKGWGATDRAPDASTDPSNCGYLTVPPAPAKGAPPVSREEKKTAGRDVSSYAGMAAVVSIAIIFAVALLARKKPYGEDG